MNRSLLFLFALTAGTQAQITVANPSFENPVVENMTWVHVLPGWTNPGALLDVYTENTDVIAANGFNYLAMNLGATAYQDLGVTYAANTIYRLRVAVGKRAANPQNTEPGNISIVTLTDSTGADSESVTRDAWLLPNNTFAEAPTVLLDTAAHPALVGKTIRIQFSAAGVGASRFDNVRLDIPPLVKTTADSGPGSLRQAFTDAASIPGANTITFEPGFTGPIVLNSEIVIGDAGGVTVDATALTAGVTVDGGAGINRIFSVSTGANVTLLGLTLTSGNGAGAAVTGTGGAIYNAGTLTSSRCILTGNTAMTGNGGAIRTIGTLTFTDCTFSANIAAGNGGAVASDGGSIASFTRCTLSGNTSNAPAGGGGAFSHASGINGLTLTHCTLTGNTAAGGGSSGGGGIRNRGQSLTLNYCIVAGNLCNNGTGPDVNNTVNLTLGGANLIPTAIGGTITGTAPITTSPLLAPLAAYGGPTQTCGLRAGSAGINAATGSAAIMDQRGFPIVGVPDICAYEAGTFANCPAYLAETLPPAATPAQIAPGYDYDGDGATNEQEWAALTDPASAASTFRITSAVRSGGNLTLTFPSVSGKTYTLWQSDTLSGIWINTNQTAITGNGTPKTFTIPAPVPGVPKRFHRVQVGP